VAITLAIDVLGSRPLAGQTEICNLQAALKVDEDVCGLQVEMDVSRVVDEGKTLADC
jgi:hypothetical protein